MFFGKTAAVVCLGLITMGVGCAKKQPAKSAAAYNPTIKPDEAMAQRNWGQSTATFTRTSVQAGPDRMQYEAQNADAGRWLDTPLFFVNSLLLPFTYINQGAGEEVNNETGAGYTGGTFTAQARDAGGSGAFASDFGGRSAPSRVTPDNAPGSIGRGTGPNAPARTGAGTASGGTGAGR